MVTLIINGANGTMGKVITQCALSQPEEFSVVGGVIKYDDPAYVPDFPLFFSPEDCSVTADIIIDFSMPDALPGVLQLAKRIGAGVVIGTTGLSEEHFQMIREAGTQIPVFLASNMSLGVNLQMDLVKRAASFLGDSFDVEIIEKHHNQKVDAPSGTAMSLARALQEQYLGGKDFVYDRHTVRQKRQKREIGIHSIRGGTIVGEHDVMFIGEDEILQISHSARSKKIFAMGALRAARFLRSKEPKVYSMSEIFADHNTLTDIYAVEDQSIITLSHVPHDPVVIADIFDAIALAGVNIDMISQTAPVAHSVDISFTLPDKSVGAAVKALESLGEMRIDTQQGLAKFSVEGFGMEHRPGIAAHMFRILADAGVKVKLVTTSETKISYCIDACDLEPARKATQKAFGLG